MMRLVKLGVLFVFLALTLTTACAAPLKTSVPLFRTPSSYPAFVQWEGLEVAIDPIDTLEKSEAIFGTDMRQAAILPLHLILRNSGSHEFEVAATQIFGITASGEMANAYTLQQASDRVRASSIGTTAATGLLLGTLAGAAVGAAIGGAVAGGEGAGAGAAIGGTAGGVSGTAAGTSDSITHRFRRELAAQDFGDRVIRPGQIEHGFLYMKWEQYQSVRLLLFDITTNKRQEVTIPITVGRSPKDVLLPGEKRVVGETARTDTAPQRAMKDSDLAKLVGNWKGSWKDSRGWHGDISVNIFLRKGGGIADVVMVGEIEGTYWAIGGGSASFDLRDEFFRRGKLNEKGVLVLVGEVARGTQGEIAPGTSEELYRLHREKGGLILKGDFTITRGADEGVTGTRLIRKAGGG